MHLSLPTPNFRRTQAVRSWTLLPIQRTFLLFCSFVFNLSLFFIQRSHSHPHFLGFVKFYNNCELVLNEL